MMSKWLTPKNSTIAFMVFTIISLLHPALKSFLLIEMSIIAMFMIILLHECGHLLFGKWADYEFTFLIIGPFSIEKTERGMSINENNNWLLFGGAISMLPKTATMQQIRKQHLLFVAGGPIVSLALALIAFGINYFTESDLWFYFSLGNAIIFLVTAIPLKLGMDTDGRVILQLLKGGQQAEKLLQAITFSNELLSKKSPLAWNQAYLEIAKAQPATLENMIYASYVFYVTYMQKGYAAASDSIAHFKMIPVTKENKYQVALIIHIQQLDQFFSLNKDMQKINEFQQNLTKVEPVSFYRGQAILYACQGNKAQAEKSIQKVEHYIAKGESLYGFYHAERKLTQLVKEHMREAL